MRTKTKEACQAYGLPEAEVGGRGGGNRYRGRTDGKGTAVNEGHVVGRAVGYEGNHTTTPEEMRKSANEEVCPGTGPKGLQAGCCFFYLAPGSNRFYWENAGAFHFAGADL